MNVGSAAIVAGQLVVVIELDGIEGAEFGAEATVHADVNVNVEVNGFGFGTAVWQFAPFNPDTLRRAYLGTDAAGCTPIFAPFLSRRWIVGDQKGHKTETFRHVQLFFRVKDRLHAAPLHPLAHLQRLVVIVTATPRRPIKIIQVRIHKMFHDHSHAFKNASSVHFLSEKVPACFCDFVCSSSRKHEITKTQKHSIIYQLLQERCLYCPKSPQYPPPCVPGTFCPGESG